MLKNVLKELCSLDGVSGYEDDVRKYIEEKAAKYADETTVDPIGNLIIFKKGKKRPKRPVMICAHMDEVGFLVNRITEDGLIRAAAVGGIDPRVLIGRRLKVGPKKLPGIISLKAIHLTTAGEREKSPALSELYVDIGASSRGEAEAKVSLGDQITFDSEPLELGDKCLKAKAIDDRVGCAVMLEMLKDVPAYDTYFVFDTNEEIGSRGATVAAQRIEPGVALIIEGTTACDMPGVPGHMQSTRQRRGAAFSIVDGGTVYSRTLREKVIAAADKAGVKWQYRESANGSTDSGVIHLAGSGALTVGLSAPVRYIHSACCMVHLPDVEEVLKAAKLFIKEAGDLRV